MAQSKLTSQGQISVPAEIRRKLGLGPGSVIEWVEAGDQIVVRRAASYSSVDIHRAVFREQARSKSISDLKEAAAEYVRKKHARR